MYVDTYIWLPWMGVILVSSLKCMQWVKDKWLNPSRNYNRKEPLADVDEVAIRDGIECSKE